MAPKGTKRKSTTDAGAVAKCQKVQKALTDSLLKGMAKTALMTYKAERHTYENDVLAEIGQALDALAKSKSEAIEKSSVEIAKAPAEKEERIGKLKAAEAALVSVTESVAAKKAECKAAGEATEAAKAALKTAKDTEKKENKEVHKLEALLADLTQAGVLIDASDKKALKLVSGFAEFDSSLMSAMPGALKEDSASRSPFNQTTIDQFKAALSTATSTKQAEIAKEKPGVDARAAAVTAATEAAEKAKAAEKELEGALEALHGDEKEAKKAVSAAKKEVAHYWPDMKSKMDGYDSAKEELTDFNTDVIGAFNELKEREAPPPEPEPVEEEAAPAAEETPAAEEAPAA